MKTYKIFIALWIGCVAVLLGACGPNPSTTRPSAETKRPSAEDAISDCLRGTSYENAKLVNWAKINNFLPDFDGQTVVLIGKFRGKLDTNFSRKHSVGYRDVNNQYFTPHQFEIGDNVAREWVEYTNGSDDFYYGIVACQVFAKNKKCYFTKMCGMNAGNKITFKSSTGSWAGR